MAPSLHGYHTDGNLEGSVEVFLRSVAIVGVAELFDKTWFMALLLALRYRALTVFVGSFSALFVHVILAAALGYTFARFLSMAVLNYMTAAVMLMFTFLYAKDWYDADPDKDAIEAGKEDAADDAKMFPDNDIEESYGATKPLKDVAALAKPREMVVLGKCFMAVFIAEWGDRTQIAMIGQHASQPLVPVFLGSVVAFAGLTLSAVGAARLLQGQRIREKVIHGVSAVAFGIFTLLALHDGYEASRKSAAGGFPSNHAGFR